MKSHLLTFYAGTHIGQKLADSYPEVMRKFTKYNEKLRDDKEFWFSQIANMDETPLFMNIASTKTIARIGSKEVVIKTHGQEKQHVTAILCITADATKLPLMLVFKGRTAWRKSQKEKNL